MRRERGHVLVLPPSHECTHALPGNGSTTSHASGAPQCSWTSSWFGSGRMMACSYHLSNRLDSQCESSTVRVLQQRHADLATRLAACDLPPGYRSMCRSGPSVLRNEPKFREACFARAPAEPLRHGSGRFFKSRLRFGIGRRVRWTHRSVARFKRCSTLPTVLSWS